MRGQFNKNILNINIIWNLRHAAKYRYILWLWGGGGAGSKYDEDAEEREEVWGHNMAVNYEFLVNFVWMYNTTMYAK